jgi:phosphatidyl-myo-inositol dimannoside synthase
MHNAVLFLTLRVFSATGGIEKVCRVVCKALSDLNGTEGLGSVKVLSMYDGQGDADAKYISPALFSGYGQKKMSFVKSAILQGRASNIVILSHVNLLSIGFLIKLFSPQTKLVLFAHGIEVWGPLSGLRKKMLNKCDRIFSVSQFTKDTMMQLYQVREDKITVLNNCIDPFLPPPETTGKDSTLQKKYGFKKDDIVLMTLTRLSSKELYKGYDHVLFSLGFLKDKYPAIKYLIVGRYDDKEKERLDKIIQELSLQEYVVFTGYIPDEQLAKHYRLADIYVMPSKKEGFGIVFIEAMHYGLPVIAGNKDGSVDALCNGKLGILVNPDNQEEINEAIQNIILQKDKYLPNHDLLMQCFSYSFYKEKLKQAINGLLLKSLLLHAVLNYF